MLFGSLTTCRSFLFSNSAFFLLLVCCLLPKFVGIDHNFPGVFFMKCSPYFHPNILSCSFQPKGSSSSDYRTCSHNASGLTGFVCFFVFCWILWPGCSSGFLRQFFHEDQIGAGVAEQLDYIFCLPHLPGGLLQPSRSSWAVSCFLQNVCWPLLTFFLTTKELLNITPDLLGSPTSTWDICSILNKNKIYKNKNKKSAKR